MDVSEECHVECECGEVMTMLQFAHHACDQPSQSQISISANQVSEGFSEDNLVARLAEAVQARAPLWDHTLPLKLRGKNIREKLWREVHQEIGGQISLESLEKKFRNLKDTFLKHLRTYQLPSGSGTGEKKKWKHFDSFYFLAAKNVPKPTIGNFPEHGTGSSTSESLLSPASSKVSSPVRSVSPETTPSAKNLKRGSDKQDGTEKLLLDILKEPPPTTQQLSPALLTLQSVLMKLPLRVRMKTEIEMLQKVYDLYDQYCGNDLNDQN